MPADTSPSVSIIVPCYNMGEYIGDAIDSVLEQTFGSFEVVVIDDGSTDDSRSVIAPYTDPAAPHYDERVVFLQQPNKGKSAAVNYGLREATGRYITFLDADDILPRGSLGQRMRQYQNHDGPCDVVIGSFQVFDEDTFFGVRRPPKQWSTDKLRRHFYIDFTTPFHLNSCLIPRDVVAAVGPFDESLERCIDGDYALRLLRVAEHHRVVDDVVYCYRKHRSSRSVRMRYRLQTALHRPRVIWKNYDAAERWLVAPYGVLIDVAKILYELTLGNYTR